MVDPFRRIRTLHRTTRGGSLVEVWFSLIEGQTIHRGTFGSVNELHTKIRLHQRRERPLPPRHLDQTAEQILNNANRQKSSNAGHQAVFVVRSERDPSARFVADPQDIGGPRVAAA
jgi:hypothetical protein